MIQQVSDEELIKGCLAENPHYQRLLYQRFAPKMLTVCSRYGTTREEAEDVLHEGFIIVFKKLHQFRMEGSFEGWIRKIMVNKSIEHFKKSSRMHPVLDIEDVQYDMVSPEEVLSLIAMKDLLKMIQELPPTYKMVFNLYVFEKMSHYEIAKSLGIVEGTSKSNLFDARNLLKKKIQNSLLVAKKNSYVMEDFTDDKDLDSIFTRAIDAAETLPSDKFWSKVSEEVLWKENRSFRRKAFAWRSVALLFSFLTVLLATYVFYVNNKITTIEKKITTLELQTTKNQTDANTNEKSNINKNAIVQGSNNGVAVNVPNTNQAGDNDSKTITNSKNHSLPKHNTVLTDNGGSGKSIAATISSSLTTTGKMGKANNGYYTNNENGVEAKASTLNNDIKSTVPGNDSSAASAKAGLVNIGNVNDSLQKSQTVSITRSGKTSDSAIVSLPKAKAIMPVAVETTEEPAKPIDKVKLLSRISLSAFFSPKIEEDFLKDDDDNKTLGNTAKDVKTRETDKFAYSTGIRLGFDISKHWSVFTGLNYYGSSVSIRPILSPAQQLQDGRLGYSVVTSSGVVNFSDAAMQTQPGDSIKATIESSRHYISVPLHLQYDFALARRFDFYINGGFAINFAETNAATVHWENSRFQDGNITVRNIPDVDGIQYSYVLAAGAKYRLVKGLYVFLEPGIQGSMAAINKNAPVKTYPLFLQGTGGLTFHF